jgi:chondroitin 4-sulfotransferase 11
MIVLDNYKAIYIPIYKVACSSIKSVLAGLLNLNVVKNPHLIKYPTINIEQIDSKKYNDYFKFGFVRNPWDRAVSCYLDKIARSKEFTNYYMTNGVFNDFLKYGVFKGGMNFSDFVKAVSNIPDEEADKHIRSQHIPLMDKKEIVVDFVGRFEQIDSDFAHVCKKIGVKNIKLQKKNSRQGKIYTFPDIKKDYKEYYDEESKELIRKRYKKDIEMFWYEF